MTDTPPPVVEPAIDPSDPLIEHFAYQYEFRERYLHALEEILSFSAGENDREWAAEEMTRIATEALDPAKIAEWQAAGRPLPWIDEEINPLAERIRDEVLNMLGIK